MTVTYDADLAYDESGYQYEGALGFGEGEAGSTLTLVGPLPCLEVAFGIDADTEPTDSEWIDLSERLRDFDGGPGGRQRDLDRIEAGAMTFVLSNDDRALDPTNIAGAYYPNVVPMVHVRFTEAVSGRPLFRGHADGWPMQFPFHGKDSTVVLTATDAQKVLAEGLLPGTVWEREIQALADAGAARSWFRLADPRLTTTPLDSGPSGFSASAVLGVVFGEDGLLQDDKTSCTFPESSRIEVAPSAGPSTASWTIEFLMRRPSAADLPLAPSNDTFFRIQTADGLTHVILAALIPGPDRLFVSVTVGGASATITTPAGPIYDGNIHHIMIARDSGLIVGALYLYVDGSAIGNSALVTEDVSTYDTFYIGRGIVFADSQFKGHLQELVILGEDYGTSAAEHAAWALAPFRGVTTDQAVSDALDDIGWPAARRRIVGGVSSLQDHAIGGEALPYIQRVTETEAGIFGFDESGDAVFYGREYVQSQDRLVHILTFANDPGDGLGWVPYDEIEFANDDTRLINEVRASREGGTVQIVRDSDSVDRFLRHGADLSGLLHDDDGETKDHARFIVQKRKEFRTEVRNLTVNLRDPRVDVDLLLGAFEGNSPGLVQVRVVHNLLGFDDPIDATYRVERVQHQGHVSSHQWLLVLWLSSWDPDEDIPWILGDSIYGVLGSTTRLGF